VLASAPSLENVAEWMSEKGIRTVRTMITDLHGQPLGKYLSVAKFLSGLPKAHAFSDLALAGDLGGTPHLTFWHSFRTPMLGDIAAKVDLSTCVVDPVDPETAHVIGQFVQMDGSPIDLCPRTQLSRLCETLAGHGIGVRSSMELEFFLFDQPYDAIRAEGYSTLSPCTLTSLQSIYTLRDAYRAHPFMQRVTRQIEALGIEWEAWSDENGNGQIELNLAPLAPLAMADAVMRARQVIFEVAQSMGLAASFMPQIKPGHANGMHIHHSLHDFNREQDTGVFEPLLFDASEPHHLSALAMRWIAGLHHHLPASVSLLCPSINSFRRLKDFSAAPTRQGWGLDHKSAPLRVLSPSPGTTRIEHRVGSSDLNPYLAMSAIIASGLCGLDADLELPPPMQHTGWGQAPGASDLPSDMVLASQALANDQTLQQYLGKENAEYWLKARRHEWLSFQEQGNQSTSVTPTLWEFERGFAKL